MIGLVGINHTTAPVEVRERLSFDEEEIFALADTVRELGLGAELVVLSTCNRTEVYVDLRTPCERGGLGAVRRALCEEKSCDADSLSDFFYEAVDREAVEHLLRVAAGLDSMVLGENQILGQVKEAYRISASQSLTSTVLNRLFHLAFSVGKRVRSETGINEGASSASYAAVELAAKIFDRLSDHPVTLIGTGETGELVLESLVRRGCTHIHVANRTVERARSIAQKYRAEVIALSDLEELILHSDIVVTSTAATEPILNLAALAPMMRRRGHRPLFLIDLAVPRNIDDDVKRLDEVFLYDIDDLEQVVAHNRSLRASEIAQAEEIVKSESDQFFEWLNTLALSPTIQGLKSVIGKLGAEELRKLSNRLPPEEYRRVEEYAKYIEGKYLGLLVRRLKALSQNGRQLECLDIVNRLFDLPTEEES